MRLLLPLFIITPVLEMWFLLEVGSVIGALATIGLVLLTAMIGLRLLKQQGLATLLKVNQKMEQGSLPASELVEGFLLAVGGALLLTPGFFTDALGFSFLLPFTRHFFAQYLLKKGVLMSAQVGAQNFGENGFDAHFYSSQSGFGEQHSAAQQSNDDIIEGEFSRPDEENKNRLDKG